MSLQVIAWDPGKTTGLCILEDTDHIQLELEFHQVGDLLRKFEQEKCITKDAVFVCESFTINNQTARNSQAPWSLEVIGLIRYFCISNAIQLQFQQPSATKNLIKDEVIKNADLWVPGKGHAMDATRHALHYCITQLDLYKDALLITLDEN